jgi:hypothetical protein
MLELLLLIFDLLLIIIDVPLAWLGNRVLWMLSLGRIEKLRLGDLIWVRKLSNRQFSLHMASLVTGVLVVVAVIFGMIMLGPIPSVHEWRS